MNFITKEEEEFLPESEIQPKIRRRAIRDSIVVCPVCFSKTENKSSIFRTFHKCSNSECGWEGSITIEVSVEDYEKHKENQQS